jgi:hypothetical protein
MSDMKKYIFGLAIMLLAATISSCNDDRFLEEHPGTFYTIDNIFSTSEQVDQVLVSIYSHIRNVWVNPSETGWIFNLRGKGTDMYDVANIRRGDTFSDYSVINPLHSTYYEVYSTWYYVVARANLTLYAAELPQITWASAEDKAYAVAQARFFRAFAYKNLGELFGGVPIVTEIAQVPRYDYERTSRVETYQFAISEMEAVLEDLPVTTNVPGRLVRGAAQHNLAELYLAMGTQLSHDGKTSEAQAAFSSSISYAGQLIDGGVYSLVNERFGTRKDEQTFFVDVHRNGIAPTPANDTRVDTVQFQANYYWDLFQDGNVHYQNGNQESIWTLQIDYAAYRKEDGNSKLPYTRSYGPVWRDGTSEIIAGILEDVGGRGICSVNITMYARDRIYEGRFADDMRNSDAVFRRRYKGNVDSSPWYLKEVPWDYIYGRAADAETNTNNRSFVYPMSCKICTDKFQGLEDGENRSNLFRDEYVIRLSETILLRAEARQRSGDKAGAAADINLLRNRAKCSYQVTAADMDDEFNLILDERARELIYEECRWNTLLRMGGTIAVDRIRQYAYWPETASTLTFNYNLWPIPQSVIDVNKDAVMEQNPGWTNR